MKKVLNLYAGVGGNRKLWRGVDVTAVEMNPKIAEVYKRHFKKDKVVVADAHEYLLNNYKKFDFIWVSRPCQRHSKMNIFNSHNLIRYVDGGLFEEIIFLKTYFKGKWVVENVVPYYEPIYNPFKIGRHLFWSNFTINEMPTPPPVSEEYDEAVNCWAEKNYDGLARYSLQRKYLLRKKSLPCSGIKKLCPP